MPHKTIIRLSGVARNPANGFPARLLGYLTPSPLVVPGHRTPSGRLALGVARRHPGALPPAGGHQFRQLHAAPGQVLGHADAAALVVLALDTSVPLTSPTFSCHFSRSRAISFIPSSTATQLLLQNSATPLRVRFMRVSPYLWFSSQGGPLVRCLPPSVETGIPLITYYLLLNTCASVEREVPPVP